MELQRDEIKNIIDGYEIKKKEIDEFINKKCVHLEYRSEPYDDGHRWHTNYYCNICAQKFRQNNKTELEKRHDEMIWIDIKKSHTDGQIFVELIKYYKTLLSNINSVSEFRAQNGCDHDIMIREKDQPNVIYKCSNCNVVIKFNI